MFDRDYNKTTNEIISFIQKTLKEAGFTKVVIGVSGGVDSATACFLLVKAISRENLIPVIMPYDGLHKHSVKDAKLTLKQLKIPQENRYEIDIQKAVDKIVNHDKKMSLFRKGNIMSRVRMIYLYDLAKKHQALVCGTENRTEYLLGYFTRYGDEASDFEPLRRFYKTEIKALAQYLGVSAKIIAKSPTAGLWPGQTDEEEFGFSYEDADTVLYLAFDRKMAITDIIKTSGINASEVKKILKRVSNNAFKHNVPKIL